MDYTVSRLCACFDLHAVYAVVRVVSSTSTCLSLRYVAAAAAAAAAAALTCMPVQVRTCRQGIVDYFTNFLQLRPYGTVDKCIIRELAPDVAINSGIYTFKLTKDTGKREALWWDG